MHSGVERIDIDFAKLDTVMLRNLQQHLFGGCAEALVGDAAMAPLAPVASDEQKPPGAALPAESAAAAGGAIADEQPRKKKKIKKEA